MKAVFVGAIDRAKFYYVIDAKNDKTDGVLVDENGKAKVVPFWDTAMSNPSLRQLKTGKFHKFLWSRPKDEEVNEWRKTFILKTKPIEEELLRSVPVNNDIMKAGKKSKSLNERAESFKVIALTQNVHEIRRKALG